jgi:hypothetical protein
MDNKLDNIQNPEIVDPELYLWNDEQNRKNYRELLSLFNRSRFVSFIGAGVSKSLGIQDWKGLLIQLAKVVKSQFNIDKDIPDDAEQYPEYAEELYKIFENHNAIDDYNNELSRGMRPTKNSTSLTLVKLALAINTHLTTNFDSSLEYAYRFLSYLSNKYSSEKLSKHYEIRHIPLFGDYLRGDGNDLIFYLHGNVSQHLYLLRESQYKIYYPSVSNLEECSRDLESLLNYYYRNRNIIFIGFSFSDFYVREYFFAKAKEIKKENLINKSFVAEAGQPYRESSIKHFLLIDTKNKYFSKHREKIFEQFHEYNIYPVIYREHEHIFLETLFEVLAENKNYL